MTRKQVVVAIALCVGALHFVTGPGYRGPFRAFVNGYLIDILLPLAMYLVLSLVERPVSWSRAARATAVLAVGAAVEALQYLGVPLFGRTYEALDLLMYALGVLGGVLIEAAVLSRLEPLATSGSNGKPVARSSRRRG